MKEPSMQSEKTHSSTIQALKKRARNNRVHLEQKKNLKRQSQEESVQDLLDRADQLPDLKVIKSETARDVAERNQKGNSTTVKEFVQSADHQKKAN